MFPTIKYGINIRLEEFNQKAVQFRLMSLNEEFILVLNMCPLLLCSLFQDSQFQYIYNIYDLNKFSMKMNHSIHNKDIIYLLNSSQILEKKEQNNFFTFSEKYPIQLNIFFQILFFKYILNSYHLLFILKIIKIQIYQIQNSSIHQSLKIMNWLRANRVGVKDPTVNRNNTFIGRSSMDAKNKPASDTDISTPDKIKSNPSFSLQKIDTKVVDNPKTTASNVIRKKDQFKLPNLKRTNINSQNPESEKNISEQKEIFYQSQVYRALQTQQTTYLMTLARQHFFQTIEALRITRNIRLVAPKKQIKLQKKSTFKKTIYLDLDQTLIHTDERSTSFSVKLTFPIETGGSIQAGVRIRPFCKEFLTQLAKFAQIIIFTASSASYADVILDHLDPDKNIFSYRLYRHHCTLQRGFYIKDLRAVNRRLEDVVIVDNSAFSFLLQPQNGIPILPFYHFSKDRELLTLLQYLRELVNEEDLRENIKRTFFFDAYLKDNNDPKRLFFKRYKKLLQQSSNSPQ